MRLLPRALVLSARSLGRPQALPGPMRGCITQYRGQGPGDVFTKAPWLEMVRCGRISILIYTMDPLCLPGPAGGEKRGAGSPQGAYLPSSSCTQLYALPPPLPVSLNLNHACIAVARTWNTYVSTGKKHEDETESRRGPQQSPQVLVVATRGGDL